MDRLKIFAGSSCKELGEAVGDKLGIKLSPTKIYHYQTGCFEVALEDNVRGCKVFLLQSSLPNENALHRHIWELFQMINAAKKASAKEITVVIPYLSYARSDKKWRSRMSIAGKLFAAMLEKAGMDRIIGIDFHSPEFQGFFDTDTIVDHLPTLPLLAQYLREKSFSPKKTLILPGDGGFYEEAKELGARLSLPVGSVIKKRVDSNTVRIEEIDGKVKGKNVIIADDEICTAGTTSTLSQKVHRLGATSIIIVTTHGLFQGKAIPRLQHPWITEIIVTDTIPLSQEKLRKTGLPIKVVSIVPLLATAIREIYIDGSVSRLFHLEPENY